MKRFLIVVFVLSMFVGCSKSAEAQCCAGPMASAQYQDVNVTCAIKATAAVAACRADGGGWLGCAFRGVVTYIECDFMQARNRVRSMRNKARGRRALRATQRQSDRMNYGGECG